MIDNFSIFFTTALIVYVVWKASRLDGKLPWFPKPSKDVVKRPRTWREDRWASHRTDEAPAWRR